jgi:hypothetical protein
METSVDNPQRLKRFSRWWKKTRRRTTRGEERACRRGPETFMGETTREPAARTTQDAANGRT